jgi:hypothetical protein
MLSVSKACLGEEEKWDASQSSENGTLRKKIAFKKKRIVFDFGLPFLESEISEIKNQ